MTTSHGVDHEALEAWLADRGLGSGRLEVGARIGGGTQNVLLPISRGELRCVLRRPPLHKRANSDATMLREARVLEALAGTDVPHPRLIAACADAEVIGAVFYLMEAVPGSNPTVRLPDAYVHDREWRRRLGMGVAREAAAVGAVDHIAVGLADFGRPEGYLERQVDRWRAQLDSYAELADYPAGSLPDVVRMGDWLEVNRPTSWRAGLMHGDYHLANVIADPARPGLSAIVDWELATIGDPLLDLGGLLAGWPGRDEVPAGLPVYAQPWDGFPDARGLVEEYAEHSDRDLSALDWYVVLASYRLAIIIEGTYAQACAGLMDPAVGDKLHTAALWLCRRAGEVIRSS